MRGFPRLAVSYAVNELGDNLGVVALAILVYDRTDSALAVAALFVAARFIPAFVAPALTARIDRAAPRRILPLLYAVEALAFAGLALLASDAFLLAGVLALALVDGTIALTARALTRGVAAALLRPRGLLREGNALLNVAFAVASAAGPALAGVLVATAGVSAALWVDAVSFAVVGVLLATAGGLPAGRPESAEGWRERVRGGLRAVRESAALRTLVLAQTAAFVFFFLVIPIEVVYVKETLDRGDLAYGALLSAWGVGLVLGSSVFARLRDRPAVTLIGGSTALVGAGYLGLAAAPDIALACVASVVGGAGNGVQWVAVLTTVQEAIDDDLQARVVGLLESVAAAAPGIGYLIGGLLAAVWSPRLAYLVAGIGVLSVAAAMATRLRVEPPVPSS